MNASVPSAKYTSSSSSKLKRAREDRPITRESSGDQAMDSLSFSIVRPEWILHMQSRDSQQEKGRQPSRAAATIGSQSYPYLLGWYTRIARLGLRRLDLEAVLLGCRRAEAPDAAGLPILGVHSMPRRGDLLMAD